MSWLTKIFSTGAKELTNSLMEGVGRISEAHLGKKELKLEIEKIVAHQQDRVMDQAITEISAKERIMVAELTQGDSYTKRARPTIVYVGLIGAIVDAIQSIPFSLSPEFWYVWGSVCAVYSIGRTMEKRKVNGVAKKIQSAILGG